MSSITRVAGKIIIPTPFAVGDVNTYLLKGDALTLVDAGIKTQEAKEALERQLKELGYRLSDIEQVILTHHHSDHCGLIDVFQEDPLYGHEDNQRYLKRDPAFMKEQKDYFTSMAKQFGVPPQLMKYANDVESLYTYSGSKPLTHFLKEGDWIPGHPGWRAMETFGHSQGHLSFYHEESGTLIGGDLLLGKISPNPILEVPKRAEQERLKPQLQLNDSLRRLQNERLTIVYPGHGKDITEPYQLIEKRLKNQHERAFHVKSLIGEDRRNVLELAIQLFPKAVKRDPALALFETLGQLDYLDSLHEIESEMVDGVVWYYNK
ncbi:MBL fold metallo-hydrolase [Pradoshia sp. D12]|uniref:MBL fold metallo-hydrolase n=1 Tax=Bacillaceae TaxID=186817 RepID=UPI00112AD40C|nr:MULTISPECIES: MBL fold metallo-hydrolase [Bacillaceae]QFK72038.1 MBL fold metallo-hydrolase [Pradoshia sp. D12]TPF71470.1 MBL fold metallo-hydrolase [Bacillus sp. D12]